MRTNIDENIKTLKKEIELKKKYTQIKYQIQHIKGALLNGDNKLKKIFKEHNKKQDSISKEELINEYRKAKDLY